MKTTEIKCPSCGVLYGKEVDGVLTIKYRDLYRHFDGGKSYGPCRGCGYIVTWPLEKKVDHTRS